MKTIDIEFLRTALLSFLENNKECYEGTMSPRITKFEFIEKMETISQFLLVLEDKLKNEEEYDLSDEVRKLYAISVQPFLDHTKRN